MNVMTLVYDLLFLVFAILSIPKFLLRLNQAEDWIDMFSERFGRFRKSFDDQFSGKKVVWLHAVSVGEVMALRRWIQLFGERYPDWVLALSVTTPTGHEIASKLFSDRAVLFYAPFDISFIVRRFLRLIQPKLILLMETEIWPNLISQAARAGVTVGILNGRISARSFRRYSFVRYWMRPIVGKLTFCLVQSEHDRERFLRLGMNKRRTAVLGNMKFDQIGSCDRHPKSFAVILSGAAAQDRLREGSRTGSFGPSGLRMTAHDDELDTSTSDRLVIVAGSTSWNEEQLLLGVFKRLRQSFQRLQLVLAPRHPEQISKVLRAVKAAQLPVQLFSKSRGAEFCPILLVDQMGILASLYRRAHIVFVGGSLVRRGGQNPIEAAVFRKPLVHGPHVFNFSAVYQALDERDAAICVHSEDELFQKFKVLLEQPELRERMGNEAFRVVQTMKGATMRTMDFLSRWIRSDEPVQTMVQS